MTVQFYPNGIGGTAPGDSLDLARPLQTTGNVWYVSSLIGTDSASPAGQNREKPLATLARAILNAADDDIIVFLPGHAQTLTVVQTIAKRLTLIGEGTTAGKPAASFTMNANATMFDITATNVELRNLYFPPNSSVSVSPRIAWTGARGKLLGCYVECGANDGTYVITLAADTFRIDSSTLISVATASNAQPFCAFRTGIAVADLEITNTVVSSGPFGFSNYAAVDLTAGAATRCNFQGLSLLLGADVAMGAAATGRVNVQLATGGSRVSWG